MFNLYRLHGQKHQQMSPKNLVNLLVKILQLRKVGPKKDEESPRLERVIRSVTKQMGKMAPEDMIRFLFCLKKVKATPADIRELSSFLKSIISEVRSLPPSLCSETPSRAARRRS